jgi:murein tripeptide amidase MpaA
VEEANEGEIPTTTVATPSEEEPAEPEEPVDETQTVIGASVEERDIIAYHYGEGDTELLFVGGIHGGYEWNTVLVAYELMDYLEENPEAVPENVKVTVIPVLNPDGLFEVVGSSGRFAPASVPATQEETVPGRFNANDVDLNRNFDCDWQESATWQNRTVSGGRSAFSEPEAEAIRDYVEANDITAAVVWYSAAGGVFASNCHNGVLPETSTITDVFAEASGYPAYQSFDFYEITGDMVNWFAAENIPGISVLLTTHEDVEWEKNLLGIQALLEHYGE